MPDVAGRKFQWPGSSQVLSASCSRTLVRGRERERERARGERERSRKLVPGEVDALVDSKHIGAPAAVMWDGLSATISLWGLVWIILLTEVIQDPMAMPKRWYNSSVHSHQ